MGIGLYDGGPCSGILKVLFSLFFSSFSSFFLFYSSFFIIIIIIYFFVSLSGAPLAPGPLDIVHPCHPVATPLLFDAKIQCINRTVNTNSKFKVTCKNAEFECRYIRTNCTKEKPSKISNITFKRYSNWMAIMSTVLWDLLIGLILFMLLMKLSDALQN